MVHRGISLSQLSSERRRRSICFFRSSADIDYPVLVEQGVGVEGRFFAYAVGTRVVWGAE